MDHISMPCAHRSEEANPADHTPDDSTDTADVPTQELPVLELPDRDTSRRWGPVDIAVAWTHLPTGSAAVHGVVRHPDGGPIVAGSLLRNRPIAAGGIEVLYEGVDPVGDPSRYHPTNPSPDPGADDGDGELAGMDIDIAGGRPLRRGEWALSDTDAVTETLQMRGWTLVTRAEAARLLGRQGYRLRRSTSPGHVLYADHADEQVWHDWVAVNGQVFAYVQVAFVVRPAAPPPLAAGAAGEATTYDTDTDTDTVDVTATEAATVAATAV